MINIITFEEYDILNEKMNIQKFNKIAKNLLNYTIIYFSLFNGLYDTKKLTFEDLIQYTQNMDVRNDDDIVKDALEDVKNKVRKDDKILNKEEVLMQLDSVAIVRKKSDRISRQMYLAVNSVSTAGCASSFSLTFTKKKFGHDCNIIFLDQNADYNEIVHELSHVVEIYMKKSKNFDIKKLFDFKKTYVEQLASSAIITNGDIEFGFEEEKLIQYLSSNSEIYSRLSSLKYFLYKRGYIENPNDKISKKLISSILKGDFYEKLSDDDKKTFLSSDFISLLIFINLDEYDYINQYVDLIKKENNLI